MNTVERAKELARANGMTLLQLAKLCRVSYTTLKSAETRHSQLSVNTIELICAGLHISLSDFFAEPGSSPIFKIT